MKHTKVTPVSPDVISEQNTKDNKLEEPVKVKKKRGRKKKIKTPEEIEKEKNYKPKRRGRKPKNLINNINEKNSKIIMENINKEETIILNLKIDKNDNLKELDTPVGFDNINSFESIPSKINSIFCIDKNKELKDNLNNNIIDSDNNFITNLKLSENVINSETNLELSENVINSETNLELSENVINSETNLQNKLINSDEKKWKENTNIKCHWCCHSFNNTPFGIPIKYKNDKFYVHGIFCSLECAAAHNFSEEKGIQDIWESYNLLNLLSHKINYKNIVRLAPKRNCLNIFGGRMSIEEFRSFTNQNKIINILEYPMISASQKIEEINYDNNSNKNNFIPIDQERVKKLEQKIKLMRRTPLLNHKNTLEHTMNIKISTD